ncbi:MAG: hypothetical protein ACI9WU_003110 [Myxococcota bacterium]|jgi:hypothetical protein
MREELLEAGMDVDFVSINKHDAVSTQEKLIEKVTFALLQDQDNINVWELMDGVKDDFYVYNSDGTLSAFLPVAGDISVNLSTEEGYDNLKTAILAAQ